MGNIGIPELIIFAVILLLLFGAKRVPEIARSLGSGMREFKEGIMDGGDREPPAKVEIPAADTGAPTAEAETDSRQEAEKAKS